MRRNARAQIEKPREPVSLLPAERGDGHEIIRPADHRADGNHHDIDQRINHLAAARIGQRLEMILNTRGQNLLRHGNLSPTQPHAGVEHSSTITGTPLPQYRRSPRMAQSPWPLYSPRAKCLTRGTGRYYEASHPGVAVCMVAGRHAIHKCGFDSHYCSF